MKAYCSSVNWQMILRNHLATLGKRGVLEVSELAGLVGE